MTYRDSSGFKPAGRGAITLVAYCAAPRIDDLVHSIIRNNSTGITAGKRAAL